MKFKYIEYKNEFLGIDSVVFGKKDPNVDSIFQIVKIDGYTKSSTSLYKNNTIDSQEIIFRGNRLPQRQIMIGIIYQQKENLNQEPDWNKKEEDIIKLIKNLSTTGIQNEDNLGELTLTTRNDKIYVIPKVSPVEVVETDSSKPSNNYAELNINFISYSPYLIDTQGNDGSIIYDLSSNLILTDFVKDSSGDSNSILEFELEERIEGELGTVNETRDGYISNQGIFYYDDYGQFWLNDSLTKEINIDGSKTYPTIRIDGFVENPKFINKTTNTSFGLNYTIQTGEYVIIDNENKTCLLYKFVDGKLQTEDLRGFVTDDTTWIYFQEGPNETSVEFSSADASFFKVIVDYKILLEGIGI